MKLHLTNFTSVNKDEITEYSDECDILPAVQELMVPVVPETIAVLVQVVLYNIVFKPLDIPVGLLLLRVRDIFESMMLQIG